MQTALIILAAGKGTRMQSDLPKVLHPIGGVPMLGHVLATGRTLEPDRCVVITGHGSDRVEALLCEIDPDIQTVRQTEQLGTGHAVAQARPALDGFEGLVLVLYGDVPLLRADTLQRMAHAAQTSEVVVLGFEPADPTGYGRLITQGDLLERIVEHKDTTKAERALGLCNAGILACRAPLIFDLIDAIENTNASGEFYLTDLPELARRRGLGATVVTCDEDETIGVDSRGKQARAEGFFQARARAEALANGITLMAPETVYFAQDTVIGRDTLIEPHVVFGPGVTVESGAHIRAFSHLEGCHVARGSVVGPYARLRPGTELSENVRVGNFVEVKNATLDAGAKLNHLSYVGDAFVGAAANVGAGTITCNYDGVMKHKTTIGAGAFIGSNTMLVAPVTVGDGALTGSGSVITQDVPADAIAVARAPQNTRLGKAKKLFHLLRAKKARQTERS